MAKDPAFLFYSSDFISGVQDLTMEERGQYITLLCLQHQKGHLTEKMIRLCCGNATADVLAKFRQDENGLFFNERLETEREKRKAHGEKQRARAIDGWKKRKNNNCDIDATASTTAYATAMPLEDVNENENINEVIVEDANEKKTMRKKFVKPQEHEVCNYMGELSVQGSNFLSEEKVLNFARVFIDHYEANGWIAGKVPMKDWRSSVRNWMRREWDKVKNQKQNTNGKQSNSTSDSIAKANQLYAEAVAISRARNNTGPDRTTAEA
jgi:uncharacterized protein YdaU (DUF1376 family)